MAAAATFIGRLNIQTIAADSDFHATRVSAASMRLFRTQTEPQSPKAASSLKENEILFEGGGSAPSVADPLPHHRPP